jgi:hypothetical protein
MKQVGRGIFQMKCTGGFFGYWEEAPDVRIHGGIAYFIETSLEREIGFGFILGYWVIKGYVFIHQVPLERSMFLAYS